jgi:hypothetical protein
MYKQAMTMDSRKSDYVVQGMVEAPVVQVWAALIELTLELSPADRKTILHGAVDPYLTSIGKSSEGKISVDVHLREHKIGMQGEWWYRGVRLVEPHARGSLITYAVYNIAPSASRWMAQLVQAPAHARKMPDQMREMLRQIGQRLQCRTEMIATPR